MTRPAVEVGGQAATDVQDPLDGVQSLAALIVEACRAKGRGDGTGQHLGDRDVGRADRLGRRALEVDDPEELVVVEDRDRHLAADVRSCRSVVRIGEDVGHEHGLPGRGRAADDADPGLDHVERGVVPRDADHRETTLLVGQVGRHEGHVEGRGDVVHDVLHHDRDRPRPVESPHDALQALELVGPGHLAGGESLRSPPLAPEPTVHGVDRPGGQERD